MLSKEVKENVIKLRKEGKTYKEIIENTNLSKSTISNICRKANLFGKSYIKLDDLLINKAQLLYDEIGNIKKVSKILNIGWERLSKVINKNKKIITKKEAVISWRKRLKIKLINYKGGKCQICGYNRCINALEFHHLNPNEKDFQISGISKSFETMKKEVDKCILVCANCHREIHAGLINLD